MGNVMIIKYNGSSSYRGSVLYQYDYGQRIVFEGFNLPDTYEVHFANTFRNGFTYTVLGDKDGVMIPDACLLTGKEIYVWVFLHETTEDGETVYHVQIPVISRPYISNTEPTPVQQNIITQAIAVLREASSTSKKAKEDAEAAAERAESTAEDLIRIITEQGITFDEGTLDGLPDDGGGS